MNFCSCIVLVIMWQQNKFLLSFFLSINMFDLDIFVFKCSKFETITKFIEHDLFAKMTRHFSARSQKNL